MIDIVIYFHGFASSPNSTKAQALRKIFPKVFAPKVSHKFSDVEKLIEEIKKFLKENASVGMSAVFCGTSLGGFYALYVADRFEGAVVAINPATEPALELMKLVGENTNYDTGEKFIVTEEDVLEYAKVELTDSRYVKILLGKNDNVIDPRKAMGKFSDVKVYEEDHRFDNIELIAEAILSFDRPRYDDFPLLD